MVKVIEHKLLNVWNILANNVANVELKGRFKRLANSRNTDNKWV